MLTSSERTCPHRYWSCPSVSPKSDLYPGCHFWTGFKTNRALLMRTEPYKRRDFLEFAKRRAQTMSALRANELPSREIKTRKAILIRIG